MKVLKIVTSKGYPPNEIYPLRFDICCKSLWKFLSEGYIYFQFPKLFLLGEEIKVCPCCQAEIIVKVVEETESSKFDWPAGMKLEVGDVDSNRKETKKT